MITDKKKKPGAEAVTSAARPQILVVEDERIVAGDIRDSLNRMGYEVPAVVTSGEEAIRKAAKLHPDLVVMDIILDGDMDGIEAAERILNRFNIPVIFLTANSEDNTLQRAKLTGPFGYALKPFEEKELHTTIEVALYKHKLENKLKESEQWLATTLQSIGDGVIATDAEGRIKLMNTAAEKLTGWSSQQALDKSLDEIFTIVDKQTHAPKENPATQALHNGSVVDLNDRTVLVSKDGTEKAIHDTAAPIKDEKGNTSGVVMVFSDVSEQKRIEAELQLANANLAQRVGELEQRNHDITLLSQMAHLLQSSTTVDEACIVISRFLEQLFPTETGMLFMQTPSRNILERLAVWNAPADFFGEHVFAPEDCWALRGGKLHAVEDIRNSPLCRHLGEPPPSRYLCIPMMAQGEAIFMLHLQNSLDSAHEFLKDSKRQVAIAAAEHIALALSNLKLRETLRSLSIRDPLTGLFNRRHMEESLDRELRRAERMKTPVGIIMLDLDHFKEFNDTFGHDAGDALLREFGLSLLRGARGGDIACRYGGEEFTLILPGASLEDTTKRAEQFCEGARRLNINHYGQSAYPISISLGVAVYPDHAHTGEGVLKAADAALYLAKSQGRNRVVVAQPYYDVAPSRLAD
jgi:diguanylate cyclase (GGDEF)-like protein/PAS domain S-box-containing protein